MRRKLSLIARVGLGLACCAFAASESSAYIYWTGRMSEIYFSGAGNYPFRVTPASDTPFNTTCPGNFAYMDTTDSNYQVYAAALTTAFAGGKTITLTLVTDSQGYCHFIEGGVFY